MEVASQKRQERLAKGFLIMGTSRLQQQTVKELNRIFGCDVVQENLRPEWLRGPSGHRLELDIFLPRLNIAIEIQGQQHYRFNTRFHGTTERYEQQIKRDSQKRILCARQGVVLYEVASDSDLLALLVRLGARTVAPDQRHIIAQKQAAENWRLMRVRQETREYQRKVDNAILEVKRAVANLPAGAEHDNETDRASAKLIHHRTKLERARWRAWLGVRQVASYPQLQVAYSLTEEVVA